VNEVICHKHSYRCTGQKPKELGLEKREKGKIGGHVFEFLTAVHVVYNKFLYIDVFLR